MNTQAELRTQKLFILPLNYNFMQNINQIIVQICNILNVVFQVQIWLLHSLIVVHDSGVMVS